MMTDVTPQRPVWIRINYLGISAISTKDQLFSAEVLIEARWSPQRGEEANHFDPKLVISNLESTRKETFWHRVETTDRQNLVYYCWRLTGNVVKIVLENQEVVLITVKNKTCKIKYLKKSGKCNLKKFC